LLQGFAKSDGRPALNVASVKLLSNGESIAMKPTDAGLELTIPPVIGEPLDDIANVYKIELE
ncbi:MAG: hypothetical protein RID07_11445, partial [Lacipirellulaceae bacterium]